MKMHIAGIFYGMVIVLSSTIIMAKEGIPANGISLPAVEVVATDETGSFSLRWRMPIRDSAFIFAIAQECGGSKFRQTLLQSLKQNKTNFDINSSVNYHHILGAKSVEKEKANFVINHSFADRNGNHFLQLNMPASQALGILKAVFIVGDARLKYQIMRYGFKKYENKDVKIDILAFLADAYNEMDAMSKGEMMISMFSMDAYSPHTRTVIEKNEKIVGTGEFETHIRQIAHDMLECIKTGDMTRLTKYKTSGATPQGN